MALYFTSLFTIHIRPRRRFRFVYFQLTFCDLNLQIYRWSVLPHRYSSFHETPSLLCPNPRLASATAPGAGVTGAGAKNAGSGPRIETWRFQRGDFGLLHVIPTLNFFISKVFLKLGSILQLEGSGNTYTSRIEKERYEKQ